MAVKDWEIKRSKSFIFSAINWEKERSVTVFYTPEIDRYSFFVVNTRKLDSRPIKSQEFIKKHQAVKAAKNYMRRH